MRASKFTAHTRPDVVMMADDGSTVSLRIFSTTIDMEMNSDWGNVRVSQFQKNLTGIGQASSRDNDSERESVAGRQRIVYQYNREKKSIRTSRRLIDHCIFEQRVEPADEQNDNPT